MNILFVSPWSHGASISPIMQIATQVADFNNNVHFVTVKKSYIEYKSKKKEVEIASLPDNVAMHYVNNCFPVPSIAYPFVNPIEEYRKLLRIVKINDIDILHFCCPEHLICLPILKKKSFANSPIVLSLNDFPGIDWFYGNKFVDLVGLLYTKYVSLRILASADAIVPSSTRNRKILELYGLENRERRVSTYGGSYGVDTHFFKPCNKAAKIQLRERFGLPADAFIILFAGRLAKVKRIDLLIQSFKHIEERLKNSFLLIVGDGPEKQALKELASVSCSDNCKFMNFVNHATLAELYAASDLFVLLSSGEGLPVSLLEATSSGLPAIVSNVGGSSDIITTGFNGYVLDTVNEVTITDSVADIEVNYAKFSRNARTRAERESDWSVIIGNYLEIYRSLLEYGELHQDLNY